MTSFGCEYKRPRWYVRYVGESNAAGPVPPALPVPLCRCGVEAEVKQSRHPKTAGRAFYVCKWTFNPMPAAPCDFFQWIDGPDKYDPRIRLFPYHSTKLKPYYQFRRWVPPPPNPPRMTEEEKQEAACRRAIWPTEEQVWEFESGKAPWPCVSSPSCKCKYGILATEAVVPSELRYGLFCGNAHGNYWKIRKEYDVPITDGDLLWGKIYQDMVHEIGVEPEGLYARETIIKYWRQNRSKYPRPLTENEKRENRRKLQEERELEKQRLRKERDRLGYVVDPNMKYPKGSWEEYLQQVRARKRRIEMEELQQKAEETQMKTMKALVADLPVGKVNVDKKGKGVVIAGDDDDDDDDELLCEGDSD
ncbi:hypothetical protein SETIT_3G219500v2 [Setaria italica]|uniref:GRF-type domain-containing protein n=1 Tax=Setaria italica TaxID=4555 RepID=A0A368QHI1_SETIT|nr:hypothetical protein SETIT_3G219500v2 [Setaria italica]